METILQFEADRRAFIITINSFGTELTMDDREKLYPTCGKLFPDGLARLARCEDYDQVKAVADCYPVMTSPLNNINLFFSLTVGICDDLCRSRKQSWRKISGG
jgi:V-type H+-transporting ATPase subunit d